MEAKMKLRMTENNGRRGEEKCVRGTKRRRRRRRRVRVKSLSVFL